MGCHISGLEMEEFMDDSAWDEGGREMKSEENCKEVLDKFQVQRQHMQSWRGRGRWRVGSEKS